MYSILYYLYIYLFSDLDYISRWPLRETSEIETCTYMSQYNFLKIIQRSSNFVQGNSQEELLYDEILLETKWLNNMYIFSFSIFLFS